MGVLELTLLHLKPGTKPSDSNLLHNLRTIRTQLKTNSRFFVDTDSSPQPTNLFILGLWPTLQAHHNFLASPERDEVLRPQEQQTAFQWSVHLENVESMDNLPLDGKDLIIRRLVFSDGRDAAKAVIGAVESCVWRIVGRGCRVSFKERMNAEDGMREYFLFHEDKGVVDDGESKRALDDAEAQASKVELWRLLDLEKLGHDD